MSWLTPLGLLGLISIAVLILIYILKPNFQKRIISSTYIWKLSLRYRKKKFPVNRFRDLIIFICQVLILTSCSFIIAQPIIAAENIEGPQEKILIIESSAGMHATVNNETRFKRAVDYAASLAADVLNDNGIVSVILANEEPRFIVQRADASTKQEVLRSINNLAYGENGEDCSYSVANVEGAMKLAEEVLAAQPKSQIVLYSGTEYISTPSNIVVESVRMPGEWNVAILECDAIYEENTYTLEVDLACYGKNIPNLEVFFDIYGINDTEGGKPVSFSKQITLKGDKTSTISVNLSEMCGGVVYSFESIQCYVKVEDSFKEDDKFTIHGGKRPVIRIQYAGEKLNSFSGLMLQSIKSIYGDVWDIEVKEVRELKEGEEFVTVGFDLYVFENKMPTTIPGDGVVFLINPDTLPSSLGPKVMGMWSSNDLVLKLGKTSPLTNYFTQSTLEKVIVTGYQRLVDYDDFEIPLYVSNSQGALSDPALLVKNTETEKIVIMPLSINFADVGIVPEFGYIFYNLMEYFIPATMDKSFYEIGEDISLKARGPELTVTEPKVAGNSANQATTLKEFPAFYTVKYPGDYTVTQTPISGEVLTEKFFAKISKNESNIVRVEENLVGPYVPPIDVAQDLDLLIYIAAALVALLFIEWILTSKDA